MNGCVDSDRFNAIEYRISTRGEIFGQKVSDLIPIRRIFPVVSSNSK